MFVSVDVKPDDFQQYVEDYGNPSVAESLDNTVVGFIFPAEGAAITSPLSFLYSVKDGYIYPIIRSDGNWLLYGDRRTPDYIRTRDVGPDASHVE